MKRKTVLCTMLVLCMAMSAVAVSGCKSKDKETSKEETETTAAVSDSSEEKASETTTTAETTEKMTTAPVETTPVETSETTTVPTTEPETTTEATPESHATEAEHDGLYAKAEKYIDAAFAFYEKDAGQKLNLIVFDSQIEETETGFSFDVRSRDGNVANALVAKVFANTATGEMSDEWGRTWNVSDFS